MGKHTSAYQIPLASLNLRGKKSCDPLFHLALFHFRRILGRRGSWWEKCCECFKMFFYHQSRTKWRSTHVKATLRRVWLVWVDRKWFSNVPSVEVQCMCIAGVFGVICDFKLLRHSALFLVWIFCLFDFFCTLNYSRTRASTGISIQH